MAVLKDCKVLFSNVVNIDDFSQKYQVVVSMTENQAADAEAAGLNVKTKEYDGKTQYQAGFKTKFKPRVVGADGNTDLPLTGELGRGSVVSIQYKFRDWTNPSKQTGRSQDLQMLQVKNLESGGASEFDDESDFGQDSSSEY